MVRRIFLSCLKLVGSIIEFCNLMMGWSDENSSKLEEFFSFSEGGRKRVLLEI